MSQGNGDINAPKKSTKKADADFGLGVAQIVITAATPMMEEPEQPFPQTEETEDDDNFIEKQEVEKKEVVKIEEKKTQLEQIDSVDETEEKEDEGRDSPPKQVHGGRASIPDELEPHQLARLQDLKESNA